jgi:hypothetical protein
MKNLQQFAITIAIALTCLLQAQAQDQPKNKISDGFGIAAIRFVNQQSLDRDKAGPLLEELEAQISSDTEKATFDGLVKLVAKVRTGQRNLNEHWGALISAEKSGSDKQHEIFAQAEKENALYELSLKPCYVALKTNFMHRDGTIPTLCTE